MMTNKGETKTVVTALRENDDLRRKCNYYYGLLVEHGITIDPELTHKDVVVEELKAQVAELTKQRDFWKGRAK